MGFIPKYLSQYNKQVNQAVEGLILTDKMLSKDDVPYIHLADII